MTTPIITKEILFNNWSTHTNYSENQNEQSLFDHSKSSFQLKQDLKNKLNIISQTT